MGCSWASSETPGNWGERKTTAEGEGAGETEGPGKQLFSPRSLPHRRRFPLVPQSAPGSLRTENALQTPSRVPPPPPPPTFSGLNRPTLRYPCAFNSYPVNQFWSRGTPLNPLPITPLPPFPWGIWSGSTYDKALIPNDNRTVQNDFINSLVT